MTKKCAVVDECYKMCKSSECAAAQELLIQVDVREMILVDCITNKAELFHVSLYIGTIARSK